MSDFFEEVKAAVIDDAALSQGDTPARALSELRTQSRAPFPTLDSDPSAAPLYCNHHATPSWGHPQFPLLGPFGASALVTAPPAVLCSHLCSLSAGLHAFLPPPPPPASSSLQACLSPAQAPTPTLNADSVHLDWKDRAHLLLFVTGEAVPAMPVPNPTMTSSDILSTPARPFNHTRSVMSHKPHPREGQVSHMLPLIPIPALNGASQPVWGPQMYPCS